jgi:signal transduction histidine kinase
MASASKGPEDQVLADDFEDLPLGPDKVLRPCRASSAWDILYPCADSPVHMERPLSTRGTGNSLQPYILAAALSLLALPLARALDAPSSTSILVVMASTLFGGRGPALVSILLNSCGFLYLRSILPTPHPHALLLRFAVLLGAMVLTMELIERSKKSERARLGLDAHFRSITQTSPDGIASIDQTGVILFANPALSGIFGFPLEQMEGHAISLLLPGADGLPITPGEYAAVRKDGSRFDVEATCGQFGDRTTIFLRDVSDRKRTEDSLRITQARLAKAAQIAAVAELSASIVHEISQPITAMVANGQAGLRWLAATPPNVSDARAALERVVRDGKDARAIIEGLRSVFKKSRPEKSTLDLALIVRELMPLVHSRAERQHVALDIQIPKHLAVRGDKLQLQQVLMNLVTNAIDAMNGQAGPRRLVVRAKKDGGLVRTEVADSGAGVGDYETIFESFVTTKEKGLGMGLSICRSIVEAHNGRIWAEPGATGGTIFAFTVPSDEGGDPAA